MSHIGHSVVYRVPPAHRATTLHGERQLEGSVHHPARTEFAGLVTHSHDDDTHDLVIFPPGRTPTHVERVAAGEGPGTFSLSERPRRATDKTGNA